MGHRLLAHAFEAWVGAGAPPPPAPASLARLAPNPGWLALLGLGLTGLGLLLRRRKP